MSPSARWTSTSRASSGPTVVAPADLGDHIVGSGGCPFEHVAGAGGLPASEVEASEREDRVAVRLEARQELGRILEAALADT